MALRRREKRTERSKIDATPPWDTRQRDEPNPTDGPYDERDAPQDEVPRVDLGALRVPVNSGLDVRLDVNEAQQVIAATLANPEGSVQLGVFAAPRREGIWDEVRGEIADSVRGQRGAQLREADGPFGPELVGQLPTETGALPVRFVGVDGPRWFLRAMFVGRIASEPSRAAVFEDALRNVVVVRGGDPLPVRDPLPLRLPKQADADDADGAASGDNAAGSGDSSGQDTTTD